MGMAGAAYPPQTFLSDPNLALIYKSDDSGFWKAVFSHWIDSAPKTKASAIR
jgi:hypothetical protein